MQAEAAARAVDWHCLLQGQPRLNFLGDGDVLCPDVVAAGNAFTEVRALLQLHVQH